MDLEPNLQLLQDLAKKGKTFELFQEGVRLFSAIYHEIKGYTPEERELIAANFFEYSDKIDVLIKELNGLDGIKEQELLKLAEKGQLGSPEEVQSYLTSLVQIDANLQSIGKLLLGEGERRESKNRKNLKSVRKANWMKS